MSKSLELNSETFVKWLWRLDIDLHLAEHWVPLFGIDCRPLPPKQNEAGYSAYQTHASAACSLISSAAGYSHCHITEEFLINSDALGMYDAIVQRYAPRTVAARFGMYRQLISFAKDAKETWSSTISRSGDILAYMRLMHPPEHTAQDILCEMAMFALLNTVDPEYDLVYQCFIIEKNPSYTTVMDTILRYDSASNGKLRSRPSATSNVCGFCEIEGHSMMECVHFARHKSMHIQGRAKGRGGGRNGSKN